MTGPYLVHARTLGLACLTMIYYIHHQGDEPAYMLLAIECTFNWDILT